MSVKSHEREMANVCFIGFGFGPSNFVILFFTFAGTSNLSDHLISWSSPS